SSASTNSNTARRDSLSDFITILRMTPESSMTNARNCARMRSASRQAAVIVAERILLAIRSLGLLHLSHVAQTSMEQYESAGIQLLQNALEIIEASFPTG